MRFLADQNVPAALVDVIRKRGHTVLLVRDILFEDVPDKRIAEVAHQRTAIIVTWDIKDMRRYVCRAPRGEHIRLRNAGMLGFKCPEPRAAQRAQAIFDLVEHEHERGLKLPDKRFFATVTVDSFVIER